MEDMKYLVTLTCCHLTRKYYEILHNLFTKGSSCFLQLNLPGFLSIFLKVSMYPCFSIINSFPLAAFTGLILEL